MTPTTPYAFLRTDPRVRFSFSRKVNFTLPNSPPVVVINTSLPLRTFSNRMYSGPTYMIKGEFTSIFLRYGDKKRHGTHSYDGVHIGVMCEYSEMLSCSCLVLCLRICLHWLRALESDSKKTPKLAPRGQYSSWQCPKSIGTSAHSP
jgi:hypothetical protein